MIIFEEGKGYNGFIPVWGVVELCIKKVLLILDLGFPPIRTWWNLWTDVVIIQYKLVVFDN